MRKLIVYLFLSILIVSCNEPLDSSQECFIVDFPYEDYDNHIINEISFIQMTTSDVIQRLCSQREKCECIESAFPEFDYSHCDSDDFIAECIHEATDLVSRSFQGVLVNFSEFPSGCSDSLVEFWNYINDPLRFYYINHPFYDACTPRENPYDPNDLMYSQRINTYCGIHIYDLLLVDNYALKCF
jgi:hypothetical protein